MFDDFLRTINTEILGADLIDVGLVLGDYFETKPPFENSEKKKSEFPDAFIAQQIRKRFGETEEVVIISNDKGFIRLIASSDVCRSPTRESMSMLVFPIITPAL